MASMSIGILNSRKENVAIFCAIFLNLYVYFINLEKKDYMKIICLDKLNLDFLGDIKDYERRKCKTVSA